MHASHRFRFAAGAGVGVAALVVAGTAHAQSCSALDDGGTIVDVKNPNSQFAVWDTDTEYKQFYGADGTSYGGSSFSQSAAGTANFKAFVADMLNGDGDSNPYGDIQLIVRGSDQIEIRLPGNGGSTDVILAVGTLVAEALNDAAGAIVDVQNPNSQFAIWDTDTEYKQFYGADGTSYGGSSFSQSAAGTANFKAFIADELTGDGDSNPFGEIEVFILGPDQVEVRLPGGAGSTDVILARGTLVAEAINEAAGSLVNVNNPQDQFAIWDTDTEHKQFYGGDGTSYGGSSFNRGNHGANNFRAFVDAMVNGPGDANEYGPIGLEVLGCDALLVTLPGMQGSTNRFIVIGFLAEDAIAAANAPVGVYGF